MHNNDNIGPRAADRSEWNDALEVVSRLAAAREAALQEISDVQQAAVLEARQRSASAPAPVQTTAAPIDPDQLARAVAEIEQASAALRRSEPALEVWLPEQATRGDARRHLSVWFLIGGIWISATLVVAGATGAIIYLLG